MIFVHSIKLVSTINIFIVLIPVCVGAQTALNTFEFGKERWIRGFTFVKRIQGLQHAPPEGGQGVLDAGAQTQNALEVRLPQQLLPVGDEVRRAAQQSRHVVHKLRHQAGVGVICLAVVVRHHLGATESWEKLPGHSQKQKS